MRTSKQIAEEMLKKANNYGRREYCECGCKNREEWNHGAIGISRFESYMKNISPEEARQLAKTILEMNQ